MDKYLDTLVQLEEEKIYKNMLIIDSLLVDYVDCYLFPWGIDGRRLFTLVKKLDPSVLDTYDYYKFISELCERYINNLDYYRTPHSFVISLDMAKNFLMSRNCKYCTDIRVAMICHNGSRLSEWLDSVINLTNDPEVQWDSETFH